jgi:hypothetical protein
MKAALKAIKDLNELTYKNSKGVFEPVLPEQIDTGGFDKLPVKEVRDYFLDAVDNVLDNYADRSGYIPSALGNLYNKWANTEGQTEETQEAAPVASVIEKVVAKKKSETKKKEVVKAEPKKETKEEKKVPEKKDAITEIVASTTEFSFDNCPTDYDRLKAEAKVLAESSANSFLLLAQRLLTIREGKLYQTEDYKTFKEFIAAEIKIAERTAYNYIDLLQCFGISTFKNNTKLEHSKLIPAIPLLNSDAVPVVDKKDLKAQLIRDAKTKSAREINEEVKDLKIKYGLTEVKEEVDKLDAAFERLVAQLPEKLTSVDKTKIKRYIKKLNSYIE